MKGRKFPLVAWLAVYTLLLDRHTKGMYGKLHETKLWRPNTLQTVKKTSRSGAQVEDEQQQEATRIRRQPKDDRLSLRQDIILYMKVNTCEMLHVMSKPIQMRCCNQSWLQGVSRTMVQEKCHIYVGSQNVCKYKVESRDSVKKALRDASLGPCTPAVT